MFFGTQILDFMFYAITDPRFGSLMTCAALFLVPTIFAGMISPYAIRIIVKDKESSGHDAGYLYFISTIGSSAGTSAHLLLFGAFVRGKHDPFGCNRYFPYAWCLGNIGKSWEEMSSPCAH